MIIGVIGVFLCAQLVGVYLGAELVFAHHPPKTFSQIMVEGSLNGTVTAISILFTGVVMAFVCIGWIALKYQLLKQRLQMPITATKTVANHQDISQQNIPSVRGYLGLRDFKLSTAAAMFGLLLLFVIASESVTYYLNEDPTEFLQAIYDSANPRWLLIVVMVVVAPIYEELMFRGIIWSALQEQLSGTRGLWLASLISSALFAVIHLQYGIYEISTIMLLAMLFCYARIKSGSLLLPMAMHIVNNGLAMWQFVSINSY